MYNGINNINIIEKMKKYFKRVVLDSETLKDILTRVPELKKYIKEIDSISIRINTDMYSCLVHTIISQQLANAAVDTIWNKLVSTFKKVTAKVMSEADYEVLCSIGLTSTKASLIKKLAQDIVDKKLKIKKFKKMSDQQIAEILTQYKGIGNWTVENFLIFSLYRPNIFPYSDYGIARAMKLVFNTDKISEKNIQYIYDQCNGILTTLTICLWFIANNN